MVTKHHKTIILFINILIFILSAGLVIIILTLSHLNKSALSNFNYDISIEQYNSPMMPGGYASISETSYINSTGQYRTITTTDCINKSCLAEHYGQQESQEISSKGKITNSDYKYINNQFYSNQYSDNITSDIPNYMASTTDATPSSSFYYEISKKSTGKRYYYHHIYYDNDSNDENKDSSMDRIMSQLFNQMEE